jgi:DNA-binding transcriptional ArsR family regulator
MSKNKLRSSDPTSQLFFAFAHPLRRQVVRSLLRKPASASSLAETFGMPVGNVSYHLCRVLFEQCDLVEIVETHQRRGAWERVFALKPQAFFGVVSWAEIPSMIRAEIHGEVLNCFVENATAALEAESTSLNPDGLYKFHSVAVDLNGRQEIREAIEALTQTVAAVEERCRASSGSQPLVQLIVGAAAFEAAPSIAMRA